MPSLAQSRNALLEIRKEMIDRGYILFELYEAALSDFVKGTVSAADIFDWNLDKAARYLFHYEQQIDLEPTSDFWQSKPEGTSDPSVAVSQFMAENGGYQALMRRNKVMFSIEADSLNSSEKSNGYLSQNEALKIQKRLFKTGGYSVTKQEGKSFYEYESNAHKENAFSVLFVPYNLKRKVSRAAFNICDNSMNGSDAVLISNVLFPCLFHYQYLDFDLLDCCKVDASQLIIHRIQLHLDFISMLIGYLQTVTPHEK